MARRRSAADQHTGLLPTAPAPEVAAPTRDDATHAQQAAKQRFHAAPTRRAARLLALPQIAGFYALIPSGKTDWWLYSCTFGGAVRRHGPHDRFLLLTADHGARPCTYRQLPRPLRERLMEDGHAL